MREYDRIIFVGNRGNSREVMAACLLSRSTLTYHPEILARGLVVLFPEPLNQKAEAVLISNGFTLEGFVSQQLEEEDLTEHSLVITFERETFEKIRNMWPKIRNLHVLTEITGDELEIFDPVGQEIVTYGLCYTAIEKTVAKLAEILNQGLPEEEPAEPEEAPEAPENGGNDGE